MKIVTWNILANEWIDKKYYKNINSDILFDRLTRFKNIFKIISKLDADVILLQEVMKLEYNKLVDLLGSNFYISKIIKIWGGESGSVSLFKKSMFTNIVHFPLKFGLYSICDGYNFFNIHLDDISIKKRYDQMYELNMLTINKSKCIIGGDFNHKYSAKSPFYKLKNFKVTNKTQQTYYINRKINIDNILIKGLRYKFISHVYPFDMNVIGSDHLPLLTVIDYKY
jgi:endonuclease/exonuclease/phosphatase family metal-dependent hydrolase